MSYTSSDPENFNRDPDSNSLASASTLASQASKTKKNPWSKFRSSVKSLGTKMSSKPRFTESTESSEQKRTKKNKKFKASGEVKPPPSEEPKEKSKTTGPKGLTKTPSAETVSTPSAGYPSSSVSSSRSYANVLNQAGSTSESNLSTSDIDTPKKSLSLDKSPESEYFVSAQNSPDSGRASELMESTGSLGDSRPPSQITEEGYMSGTQKEMPSEGATAEFLKAETGMQPTPSLSLKVTPEFAEDSKTETKPKTVEKPSLPTSQTSKKDSFHKQPKLSELSKPQSVQESKEVKKSEMGKVKDDKNNIDTTGIKTDDNSISDFIKSEQGNQLKNVSEKSETHTSTIENKPSVDTSSEKDSVKVKKEVKSGQSEDNISKGSSKEMIEKESTSMNPEPRQEKSDIAYKNYPPSEPSDEKENTNPQTNDTPIDNSQKDKPKETPNPLKDPQEATSSKTPPKALDTPPVSDLGPRSPKTVPMTVEEKLEAFLSAEGWSGPIKNVTQKSGAESQQPDKRECLYKILVIGELGTGKTSIIKRYVHQFFSQHYRATIGVDFALKVINWDPNTIIRLQLWDIAGQERFGNMTRVYYKEAVGAFIVFDVTRSATFDAVLKWKQDLDSKVQLSDGSPIPCILLANKCDQQKEGIVNTPAKMDEFCKENNFCAWFETSAKENINIDEAAKGLVSQILQNDKMSQNGRDSARDGSKFPLDGKSEEESRSCAC